MPGFTSLDFFGPYEALSRLKHLYYLHLSTIAETMEPVSTLPPSWWKPKLPSVYAQSIVPTHTFETAQLPLDLLISQSSPPPSENH